MSKIEWTDVTDNPIRVKGGGHFCIKVSPGCKNCYAEALNQNPWFKGNGRPYRSSLGSPEMELQHDILNRWRRQRKPQKHFIASMTDVFGEFVPDTYIYELLNAMEGAPKQTFQVLTKRADRACHVINRWLKSREMYPALPKNIWLGASAENQEWFDKRIIWLMNTPAQTRFLSLEPLLGPIDIMSNQRGLPDWVIVGGESGPNARPLKMEWVAWIIDQCQQADIPVFVKQLGSAWAKQNNGSGRKHRKGGNPAEWPEWVRIRMFPGHRY